MLIMTSFVLSLRNWLQKSMSCARIALILALWIPLYSFAGTQDWLNIHGGLSGWHFSALNEINSNNVSRLRTAWLHEPENVTEALTSFPVAVD